MNNRSRKPVGECHRLSFVAETARHTIGGGALVQDMRRTCPRYAAHLSKIWSASRGRNGGSLGDAVPCSNLWHRGHPSWITPPGG